jgi:hypothetical protein
MSADEKDMRRERTRQMGNRRIKTTHAHTHTHTSLQIAQGTSVGSGVLCFFRRPASVANSDWRCTKARW